MGKRREDIKKFKPGDKVKYDGGYVTVLNYTDVYTIERYGELFPEHVKLKNRDKFFHQKYFKLCQEDTANTPASNKWTVKLSPDPFNCEIVQPNGEKIVALSLTFWFSPARPLLAMKGMHSDVKKIEVDTNEKLPWSFTPETEDWRMQFKYPPRPVFDHLVYELENSQQNCTLQVSLEPGRPAPNTATLQLKQDAYQIITEET